MRAERGRDPTVSEVTASENDRQEGRAAETRPSGGADQAEKRRRGVQSAQRPERHGGCTSPLGGSCTILTVGFTPGMTDTLGKSLYAHCCHSAPDVAAVPEIFVVVDLLLTAETLGTPRQ